MATLTEKKLAGAKVVIAPASESPLSICLRVDGDRPGHRLVVSTDKQRRPIVLKSGKLRTHWERVLHPNARAHWTVKAEVMKKDIERVAVALNEARAPRERWERGSVLVTLYLKPGRRDADGLPYTIKGVLDGLVRGGVITDDCMDVIGVAGIEVVEDKERAYGYEVRVERKP